MLSAEKRKLHKQRWMEMFDRMYSEHESLFDDEIYIGRKSDLRVWDESGVELTFQPKENQNSSLLWVHLDELYEESRECMEGGGDSWMTYKGKEITTDAGYACEGIDFFVNTLIDDRVRKYKEQS